MTNSTSNENQITLSSSDYSDKIEKIELNQVTHELLQAANWREQHKLLRVFDNKFLNVNEKVSKKTVSYNIHLWLLDANPVRKRILPLKHALIAGALFALGCLVYYLIQLGIPGLSNPYLQAIPVLLVTAGAILVVYAIKQYKHVLIFFSDHGRIPLIELFYNSPSKSSFNQFAGELINAIHSAKAHNNYNEQQMLAAELSEHRRLKDEGVLSDAVYEKVKNNILTYHSQPNSRNSRQTIH
ncbi:MAG: hypothetical protein AMJ55_12875 [Gammaproteobacteria bacterium SG8_15]|nr:MAG: hypothetical protein AMJ55_12875 [Gammaproteobacteria bacterium SG8_15]